jgi:hypothetical protein
MVPIGSLSLANDDWDVQPVDLDAAAGFLASVEHIELDSDVFKSQERKKDVLVGKTQVYYDCDGSI